MNKKLKLIDKNNFKNFVAYIQKFTEICSQVAP